uniref:cDNA FLJ54187, highly similar to Homo sapiens polymerase (RNA) I associated factor 1 (PRAF1), mRNA n=1 Tax=Homo sapiens TaxID=9606 RepID=B4DW33_HUMAN|nr:unnamed protein product [Homo sapiens]
MAAEVLPSARWQYCGAPDGSQRAVLVQFSNGKLQSPGNMRFTLYENKDSTNPRKRNQRILAAETDRLSYVGNNFGTGALKCNTLCRHFVGILNKTSGQMEVYDAELFNMQPLFSDVSVESELALESQTKTYREKMTPSTFLPAMMMQPSLKTCINLKIFFPLWRAETARPDAYGFWIPSSNFELIG